MSYRHPLEVFHYDKPFLEVRTIRATPARAWVRLVSLPPMTAGFRIHNRGGFTIAYGYQDSPTKWEELEAGVADFKSFCPREIWVSNNETIAGRNVDVYVEYWIPEQEKEREDKEPGMRKQLKEAFDILWTFWRGRR